MDSICISIEADEALQEILISELSDLGAEGFEQTDKQLLAYFPELNFKSYEVSQLLNGQNFTITNLEERNWNALWESNFSPVQVGNFCGVRASFHPPFAGVTHEIVITPKMSFGTGHHATTHMMIEQMSAIDFNGKNIFDFGTGTGILAILAEKLGANSIQAIDVDDWSIENTLENAACNDCSRIQVSLGSVLPDEVFDIVLANINRNVILDYFAKLKGIVRQNGSLLLSGLLVTDEEVIMEKAVSLGFSLVKKMDRNNWLSLLLVNN